MSSSATPAVAQVGSSQRNDLVDRLISRRIDLLLVAPLVVTTLNSDGSWGFIATPAIKVATCLLAVFAGLALLLHERSQPPSPAIVATVVLYGFVLVLTSVIRQLPSGRLILLGEQVALTFAIVAWICTRPTRLLGVLFTASLVHLALAVIIPDRFLMSDGVYRLNGGSHPIQLGFEAGVVMVLALVAAVETADIRRRIVFLAVMVFAVYIAVQAFSRQSLIALSVSVVVLALVIPGSFRWVRAYLGILLATGVVLSFGSAGIASLLGAEQLSDLSSATGRTTIWARVLVFLPDFAPLGYGYAALNDATGPDRLAFAASFGENAENALLQVLLDGGVAGTLVWLAFLVAATTAIARSRGTARVLALGTVPLFISSILVSSGLSGQGLQWWWLLAVVTESARSVRRRALPRPSRSTAPVVVP